MLRDRAIIHMAHSLKIATARQQGKTVIERSEIEPLSILYYDISKF